jgi:large conductance mechanosensitive channel
MGMLKEFREFAIKGNFLDLAVGVIIGASSGKVVGALVDRIIMPPIGILLGKVNFSDLKLVLQPAVHAPDGKEMMKEVSIGYGAALQATLELVIIAFIVFLIVRAYNHFRAAAPPPPPTTTEKLLTEIRDSLAKGRATSS